VAVSAILVGLALPVISMSKKKAVLSACDNNLHQTGLAFRTWGSDHGDRFPFNVSTNEGGTRELVIHGADGFDQNPWVYLQLMSNELPNPRIVVCPADTEHAIALSVAVLQQVNVGYKFHSGTNVNLHNPNAVLAYCPFHRNVLLVDGTVKQLTEKEAEAMLFGIAEEERARHK